ncbi:MAG: TIGR00159 family protein [Candidatus Omnitrophica bacterium CG_4_10_14_0_2_um_filter_44_9]|nr:MAG: TIGR00159 family protein [Candidatus Omnitrophica bacterium CG_4_10_14_0_8_um_filter_44_12]PIZ83040.1 MAG: TIGR00159 family protein [Candidatus Omnitrophica bacterium CG_4_10_14_0_2_um_filter_44_9]
MFESISSFFVVYWSVLKPLIEITILWFVFFRIMIFFEGTRAGQVWKGIFILVVAFFLAQKLGLNTLDWILTKLFAISVIAIIVIFQPELRFGLARLGQPHLFGTGLKEEEIDDLIRQLSSALVYLSGKKIGALIALEREDRLKSYMDSGVVMDSKISPELLETVFTPLSPLHDGGLVIQGDRISAAGCLFPLAQNPYLSHSLGTRHRSALGLSEETDAVVLIVSEETGLISLAVGGRLTQGLTREELTQSLKQQLLLMMQKEPKAQTSESNSEAA